MVGTGLAHHSSNMVAARLGLYLPKGTCVQGQGEERQKASYESRPQGRLCVVLESLSSTSRRALMGYLLTPTRERRAVPGVQLLASFAACSGRPHPLALRAEYEWPPRGPPVLAGVRLPASSAAY